MNNEIPLNLLINKIQNKQAVFVVVGLGRVGLPLSSVLANSGFNVIGIDVDENKLENCGFEVTVTDPYYIKNKQAGKYIFYGYLYAQNTQKN